MDLSHPASTLAPGLTMSVLTALAQRGTLASATQIHRATAYGTETGIRRALRRLVDAGLAEATTVAGRTAYQLNTDHVLYPSVRALLDVGNEAIRRLREEIATWEIPPESAALYGSAARGDGGLGSDIDLLLIRPNQVTDPDVQPWAEQTHRLRHQVERWTGNRLQLMDRSLPELTDLAIVQEPIVEEWLRDAITVAGRDLRSLLRIAV